MLYLASHQEPFGKISRRLDANPEKIQVLKNGDVFPEYIIESYKASILSQWTSELRNRLIQENITHLRRFVKCHNDDDVSDLRS